jgi:MFS family permease
MGYSLATIAPLYISEIAPPEIRGALLVLQEFSIVLGIVIAFWTTYGTRFMAGEWSWRLPFLIQMIPGFVLGGGIFFLPFSPRWLSSKGRDDEALEVLGKLRRLPTNDPRIFQEWCEIRAEVAFKQEINRERHPQLQAPTRSNRFKLEVECHLVIAVLVGKFGGRWAQFAVEGWVAVAFLFFYMFSFGATWGPVPWAMPSEIFPSSLRAKGVALSTCSNWFNNFIIVSHYIHQTSKAMD